MAFFKVVVAPTESPLVTYTGSPGYLVRQSRPAANDLFPELAPLAR